MITPDAIKSILIRTLPDAQVEVFDRTGTLDHFRLIVVSVAFEGKNLLDRQRLVYQALGEPMKDGRIHALEIKSSTPDEAKASGKN
ncbi:MAG TPA: BolA family protein [Nitrospiria bacterium]|nr:BolA family protein [Nitrospiria bacterium]